MNSDVYLACSLGNKEENQPDRKNNNSAKEKDSIGILNNYFLLYRAKSKKMERAIFTWKKVFERILADRMILRWIIIDIYKIFFSL